MELLLYKQHKISISFRIFCLSSSTLGKEDDNLKDVQLYNVILTITQIVCD